MPAIPSCIIDPIWDQFSELLPQKKVEHPLGCHNPHIPDRVVFDKLVQDPRLRLCIREDSRRELLSYYPASPTRRVDRLRSDGALAADCARRL